MNLLYFDDLAQGIVSRPLAERPDAALKLVIRHSYGRGDAHSIVTLRWTTRGYAERDANLVRWHGPEGVPAYMVPRLWRYLAWHALRVNGLRFGPFGSLIPATHPLYVSDMCAWELTHPAENSAAEGAA
jgi:hypothetical protein